MPQRDVEPVFCGECQNEVRVQDARMLDGQILCPVDLHKRPLFHRIRARKLPEDVHRRSGGTFRGFFTSLAALMLVVGVAFIWYHPSKSPSAPQGAKAGVASAPAQGAVQPAQVEGGVAVGVPLILASVFVAFFGLLAGDAIDLLLDMFDQLKRLNHR